MKKRVYLGLQDAGFPSYIVFAENEVFDNTENNVKYNFCIFSKKRKYYKAIEPHLTNIPNYATHKEKILEFFVKEKTHQN